MSSICMKKLKLMMNRISSSIFSTMSAQKKSSINSKKSMIIIKNFFLRKETERLEIEKQLNKDFKTSQKVRKTSEKYEQFNNRC